ncbi:Gfo/Idh/MocA family protein [Zafaria sp. J156]|uniref:Gfo/Idh/MocA family protein n=1 Tax=Zafaria sp. J156 TaxID=3116490 RepID=UPI002E79EDFA|nr:Gfo/Idh/MocA family oxidoreductase [Zafaria sp. J156]MEE1622569.1 Gfo/Idh/MocA family oxidoreductase [Zafaria sp. J156]
MTELRVATIGYAFMGRAHSNAWRNVGAYFDVPDVQQAVLVGRDPAATKEAARRHGWADTATDWRDVVGRDDIDVIDICAPGWLHAEIAIAALQAGQHVLVEKPLSNTLAEARAMVDAAAAAPGQVAMVGFTYRRVPALAYARRLIAEGRLGTVRQVRASYLQDWLADAAAPMTWRLRKDTAGSGALGDIASHAVDQVQYLTGQKVTTASGTLRTFVTERPGPDGTEPVTVDDAAWATLGLDGGAVASVEVSRVALGRKNALTIEVYGSAGALAFDLERPNELRFLDGSDPASESGFRRVVVTEPEHPYLDAWWPQGHVLGWEHAFTHQAADFLGAVASGTQASPSFAEGLAVQEVLDAIESSAARGGAPLRIGE